MLGTMGAVVLFGLGAQASATTVDFGEISAGESQGDSLFYPAPATSIDDTWVFTLTETLLTAIVIDSADISFSFNAEDNAYTFTGVLPAGVYDFNVTGLTSGQLGGEYEVIVGAVAVPVPAAIWLFSGALLLVVRRATNNAPVKS
jgi:hypothetical protein